MRYYVAQGLRVGYPAGWQVDVDADLRPPMVMIAEPPWWPFGWFAEYQVSLLPHGASLEEAVEEHLEDVRDVYHDVVLEERERVVVGAGAPGYMLRSSYVEYASDMESFPCAGLTRGCEGEVVPFKLRNWRVSAGQGRERERVISSRRRSASAGWRFPRRGAVALRPATRHSRAGQRREP
ncbi:hypothetical protein [Nonomuraea angiospora]